MKPIHRDSNHDAHAQQRQEREGGGRRSSRCYAMSGKCSTRYGRRELINRRRWRKAFFFDKRISYCQTRQHVSPRLDFTTRFFSPLFFQKRPISRSDAATRLNPSRLPMLTVDSPPWYVIAKMWSRLDCLNTLYHTHRNIFLNSVQ